MSKIPGILLAAVAAAACAAPVGAFADDLLGFYVGASVGESTVRSDNFYGFDGFDHDHHFAWKALAGFRPLRVVGAEVEYLDFGHPGSDGTNADYYSNYYYGPDSHPRALAAFAVGYLPLPVPSLDVFGKVGAARLRTTVDGFDGGSCLPGSACPATTQIGSQNRWDSKFAYGVGVQSKFWGVSLRAEYERISSTYGDPDMFTVGATWGF